LLAGALGLTTFLGAARKQVKVLPGSVVRGERVLDANGCLNCHALNGRGGTSGPDFAELSGHSGTPALLATAMWNHSPRMWAQFAAIQRQVPALTSSDAADLFAYFYATLYFAPRGDAARGQTVFHNKNCANCHSEILSDALGPQSRDPLLGSWTELRDPIAWAERMWNHSDEMVMAMSNRGISWPRLSEQEMVDLVMFLSRLSAEEQAVAAFAIGEPEQGRLVFEGLCESCHSFDPAFDPAGQSKVNLLARPGPSTVMGYTAAMWNHAPVMRNRRGSLSTHVNPGEMRDLIAFLFSQRYFFEQGDRVRGAKVYEAKGCVNCHETRRAATGAPDLSQVPEEFSPITLTSALWRHGPSMLEAMRRQGLTWPEFETSEMTDLIAYLNSRLIVRVAR
jgi:cytochrome c2